MAESTLRKRLALDTNLVLDLAEGAEFAHAFRELFQERGYVLYVSPTVVTELNENRVHQSSAFKRKLSLTALLNLRSWGLRPFELAPLQTAIAERFASKLLEKRLLPEEELSDAMILAETSLAQIPLLVTSDKHLRDIDEDALLLAFNEADLFPARPAHPKRLLRALS
jgi:predicted nucleic acid-binding protein